MPTFPDTYTKAQLEADVTALVRREGDTVFAAQMDRFVWQARSALIRRLALTGIRSFEGDYTQELTDGDTSVAEPVGFSRWFKLWLEDTDGAFVSDLTSIPYSDYRRLVSTDNLTDVESPLYLLSASDVDGAPRVYAQWQDTTYLYPEVDTDGLVLRGAYYLVPSADISAEDDDFGAGDPLFALQEILFEMTASKAEEFLRNTEAANRHLATALRELDAHVRLMRIERDVPGGEWQEDTVSEG